jgi:serine/threonine protein kinase/tetratricopeptide (TPR) repeat protein
MGTPGYWSPEQAFRAWWSGKLGPASDVYGLGGDRSTPRSRAAPPLRYDSIPEAVAATCGEVPALASSRRPVPAALDAICARCLAKDPAARFASAEALALALDDVVAAGAAPPPAAGVRVGRYELLEELARGGMGVVHRGRDPAIGRDVAIKLIRFGERGDADALDRFQREARAAGKLRHPGVVPVYDFGVVGSTAYLVMDLVQGETLADRLRKGGPLDPREAAQACEAVARTLAFAHAQGIVHRDVKPSNILLRDGQPLLFDFGIARVEGAAALSASGLLLGTPSYMAPEQLTGEKAAVGPAADVYALGGTLYELLTGEVPYAAGDLMVLTMAKLGAPPEAPTALRADLDADLSAICLRCLQRAPQDRYADATLLAQDLAAWLAGAEVQANPLRPGQRLARRLRRRPALAAGAALLAGSALTIGFMASRAPAGPPPPASVALVSTATADRAPQDDGQAQVAATQAWLDRAASGELSATPDGLQEAVWGIVQHRHPAVVTLLTRTVARAADTLLDAQDAWLRQSAPGAQDLEATLARRRETRVGQDTDKLHVLLLGRAVDAATKRGGAPALAAAMRQRVGQPLLDQARVACEALGRLGVADDAVIDALGAYVRAEPDPLRALAAGLALVRLPGDRALEVATWSTRVQGTTSYLDRMQEAFRRARVTPRPQAQGPGDVAALTSLGRVLFTQGDSEGALENLTRALALDPKSVRALGDRAAILVKLNRLPEALADLERVIELDPTSAAHWANRGVALLRQGDGPGALAALDRALELDPRCVVAWAARGAVRNAQGDGARALEDAEHALELDAECIEALVIRGSVRWLRADAQGAIQDFTRVLELSPLTVPALLGRAVALRGTKGDMGRALADLTRALELEPGTASTWLLRGEFRFLERDFAGAIDDFTRAMELEPGKVDVQTLRLRGVSRGAHGDVPGALEDYTRALALEPNNLQLLEERGGIRQQHGDLPGARADYRRLLELSPRHPKAARFQAVVDGK